MTQLADSAAPTLADYAIKEAERRSGNKMSIPIDVKKLKPSKMVMPPILFIVFGYRSVVEDIIQALPEEYKEKQGDAAMQFLEKFPLRVRSVEIEDDEIIIKGTAEGLEQTTIPGEVDLAEVLRGTSDVELPF